MAEFESHAPGTFCWPELATSDQKGAVAFYRALFGWEVTEQAIGPDDVYTEFSNKGTTLAGMLKLRPEWGHIPPHWLPYFQVTDCDKSAERAKELGGRIHVPPGDIPNVGRFGMLSDPQGGMFAVFTPHR